MGRVRAALAGIAVVGGVSVMGAVGLPGGAAQAASCPGGTFYYNAKTAGAQLYSSAGSTCQIQIIVRCSNGNLINGPWVPKGAVSVQACTPHNVSTKTYQSVG